jgi:hypothetical protein
MISVTRPALLSLVASLVSASCGGNGGDTPAPSDLSPAAKAKWNEYCAHEATCDPTFVCPTTACIARGAEQGPLIEFVDCQLAKACGANDDECVASAGTTDAEREDFTMRCLAKLSATPSQQCGEYLDPIFCTIVAYPLIRKEFMRAADACLAGPCADWNACIDAATEPLGCW